MNTNLIVRCSGMSAFTLLLANASKSLDTGTMNFTAGKNKQLPLETTRKAVKELLITHPIRGKTTGWFFRFEDLPNGVWSIDGTDPWGRTVRLSGTNQDDVLTRAEANAQRINDGLKKT